MAVVPTKSWYIAILVVSSRVDDGVARPPLVDWQYKLIRATDREAAYHRALELGAAEVQDYLNDDGSRCYWEFVGLRDLHKVDVADLEDGVEIYYSLEYEQPNVSIRVKEDLRVFQSESEFS